MGPSRRARLAAARLYLIVTLPADGADAGKEAWRPALEAALSSSKVGIVQLRDKHADDETFVRRGRVFRQLCDQAGALLIVNDRVHLTRAIDADGAHVGGKDLAPEDARELLGDDLLLGLSTHDETEMAAAAARGADHVGLGPCYETTSKVLERQPGGPTLLRRVLPHQGPLPVYPIGGITLQNAPALLDAGATRLAVGAGILEAPDPAETARRLAALLDDR